MGNNPPNPTRLRKPPDPPNPHNRPLDPSTYSDEYELLFFQNLGFRVGNGFSFFYRVSTRPIRPMFKNKKNPNLNPNPTPHISFSLSLIFWPPLSIPHGRLSFSLPHGCLSPPFSPSQPFHHLRSVIQISTCLLLLLYDLSTTSGPPFRSGLTFFFSFTASSPPPLRFDLWFDLVFRLNFFVFFYLVFWLVFFFFFWKFVVLVGFLWLDFIWVVLIWFNLEIFVF